MVVELVFAKFGRILLAGGCVLATAAAAAHVQVGKEGFGWGWCFLFSNGIDLGVVTATATCRAALPCLVYRGSLLELRHHCRDGISEATNKQMCILGWDLECFVWIRGDQNWGFVNTSAVTWVSFERGLVPWW